MVDPILAYQFDLQGYLKLEGALSDVEVADINQCLDVMPPIAPGEWYGWIHREPFEASRGISYQQVIEAGEPFERLIDHPSWIGQVRHFVGGEGTFDYHHGPLFIDENFVSIRGPGEAIGMHSGGHEGTKRTQFRFHNGRFHCGQINILVALTDIGPGDGATMVIPGSHKANLPHPLFDQHKIGTGGSMDGVGQAVEVHMKAGDAILFVDAIMHGSARRVNPGDRRILVYRYGPSWGNSRFGYQPSPELLARLTPERRAIIQPQRKLERTVDRKPLDAPDTLWEEVLRERQASKECLMLEI